MEKRTLAVLGNSAGNIGEGRLVWVRLGDGREILVARDDKLPAVLGLPVLLVKRGGVLTAVKDDGSMRIEKDYTPGLGAFDRDWSGVNIERKGRKG